MPLDFTAYSIALTKTQKAIQDALAGLADINRIVLASVTGATAATPPAAVSAPASLTTFAGDGVPKPDTDPIPDKRTITLAEWLAFLDDHSITLLTTKTATWPGEGDLIGYVMYRGGFAPNVALAMAKEWGPKYPPALTHCQMLRAIAQGVPYDVPNVAHWDAPSRTWLDSTNRPYVAPTEWTSAASR